MFHSFYFHNICLAFLSLRTNYFHTAVSICEVFFKGLVSIMAMFLYFLFLYFFPKYLFLLIGKETYEISL